MPLGSVALTVIESSTSTRSATWKVTVGGVLSLAADCTVTVMGAVVTRREAESSAKPTMVKVPSLAVVGTVSVSTNVVSAGRLLSGPIESPPVTTPDTR